MFYTESGMFYTHAFYSESDICFTLSLVYVFYTESNTRL